MHDDVITPRQLLEEAQDGLGTSKILFLATLNYFIDIYNDIHIFFFFWVRPTQIWRVHVT